MTGRRRRAPRPAARDEGGPPLDRDRLPTLATLFGGYLHEDYEHMHGSLEGAIAAFAADASRADLRALADELDLLMAHAPHLSLSGVQGLIGHDLHSRWVPESIGDLTRLAAIVRQTLRD
jgi:hypothetical protein